MPTTGRSPRLPLRDCRTSRAPPFHLTCFSLKAPGNCEKEMRALVTINEIKTGRWPCLFWQSNVQRGNRIIVIDSFFATPFSDVFRLKVNRDFRKRDHEWCDHLSCYLRIVCVAWMNGSGDRILCFSCDDVAFQSVDFLGKRASRWDFKKRSPYVWRKCFRSLFDGPTISRHRVGPSSELGFMNTQKN